MKTFFNVTVEIPAPPATVWRVMADVERWPEWTPSVRHVKRLTPGPLRVGSRVRIHQPGFPPAWWRVTELEAERGFIWVSTALGLRVVARHWIEPLDVCCRVTLAILYEGRLGPLAAWWTRNVNNRFLAIEARGLKAQCLTTSISRSAG
jgi:uncharacterized membrane protein